ncbi:MAG: TIGR00730 family Rossman fold protein [Proteobacteria bacterium]|nr:TIGR00730 family Rossman fold protein [Pseudomonadota bacterium]
MIMAGIKSICVYCGSSSNIRESHRAAAREFGTRIGTAGIRLVFGGGRVGLMGLVADAALESGGAVTGVIPRFLKAREVGHKGCTELIVTENMHDRKLRMAALADAIVVLPGGLGTLDEAFEILTWKQLGLHDKPVVFANIDGFWTHLVRLIENQIAENYVRETERSLFSVASTVADILPLLETLPAATISLEEKWI